MDHAKDFFNLYDLSQGIHRNLAPGLDTRIFVGDQTMLSVLSLEPNAEGKMHSHPEQWGVLLEGSGVRLQGAKAFAVKAGDFWRTLGNVPHGFKAGSEGAPRPRHLQPTARGLQESRLWLRLRLKCGTNLCARAAKDFAAA